MSEEAVDDGGGRFPLVAWFGLLVACAMAAVSLTGLLGHLNRLTVGAALAVAFAVAVALRSRFEFRLDLGWSVLAYVPLLALLAAAAFAPPYTWDEVAYGASLPRSYALAGRFFYNADYGGYSAMPANAESLIAAAFVLCRSVVPAQLLTVAFAFGIALATAALGRRVGLGRIGALVAGAFVLLAPALLAIVTTVKNDTANAFFQVLCLLMLVCYRDRPSPSAAVLAGVFLGTALGIKYSSLQFALAAGPIAAVAMLGGLGTWRERWRHVAAFAISTALVALPWYTRNVLLLGNPLFPFASGLFPGHNDFTPTHAAMLLETCRIWRGYNWSSGTFGDLAVQVYYGFGALPALLAWPGVVVSLLATRRRRLWPLAAIFLVDAVLTFVAGFWLPRYFMSLLALAGVLTMVWVEAVLSAVQRYRVAGLVVGGALAAGFWYTSETFQTELLVKWQDILDLRRLDREEFLTAHCRYWSVAQWLNLNTAKSDRIGVGVNVQPFFYLDRSYLHLHPATEKGNLQASQTPDDFLRAFRAQGLTVLAVRKWDYHDEMGDSATTGLTPNIDAYLVRLYNAIHALHDTHRLKRLAAIEDVRVYRIEPEGAPSVR
jgi:hypothetical protein